MEASSSTVGCLHPAASFGEGDEIRINGEWLEINIRQIFDGKIYLTCATDVGEQREFVMELNHMHRVRKPAPTKLTISK